MERRIDKGSRGSYANTHGENGLKTRAFSHRSTMSGPPVRRLSHKLSLGSIKPIEGFDLEPEEVVFSETTLKRAWVVLLTLFCLQVIAIRLAGPTIQRYSDVLTEYFQAAFDSEAFEDFSDFLHHNVSSRALLLLTSLIYWSIDPFEGLHLYCLTAVGFVLKSLAKNLIRSPRVFWVSERIRCFYCGFSLPSGHSMMSVIVFTTLALRIHQPWMYAFAMLFALATWVNVIYIGTHTAADVIVGWTGGLLVVLAYLTLEHYSSPYFREGQRLDARYAGAFFSAGLLLIGCLDILDSSYSDPEFPLAWQINTARACRMDPDDAPAHMYLKLGFSNTPIVLGLGVGYALWYRTGLQARLDASAHWEKAVLCILGMVGFMRLSVAVRLGLKLLGLSPRPYTMLVYNVVQPIWVLYGAPALVLYLSERIQRVFTRPTFDIGDKGKLD